MSTASFIPGQILTAAALNDVINSKVDAENAQITGGYLEGIDHVYITGTNVSTNPSTGALTVAGGLGVGGDVFGGGKGNFAGDVSSGGNVSGGKGTFTDNLSTAKKLAALNASNLLANSSGEFGNLQWSGTAFAAGVGSAGQGPIFMNGALITTNQKDGNNINIGQGVALTVSAEILASGVVAGRAFVSVEAFNSSGTSLGIIATATTPNGTNALVSATGTTPGNTAYVTVWKGVDTSPNVPVGGLIFRRIKLETGTVASLYSQEASIAALQGNSNGELTLNVASADVTLTADQFSNSIFKFTGVLTGNRTVTVPATNHAFIVQNLTTGPYSLTIKAVGQTPSASVISGKASSLFSDSTGVYATSSVAGMQFAGVFSYAISTTFTLTQLGAIVAMTGAATTATFPAANTYPAGSGVAVANNSSGVVNLALTGADTSNLTMPYATAPNDILFIYSDGISKWTLGWYSNKFTPTFDGAVKAAGLTLSGGNIKFPDGTIQTTATQGNAPTITTFSTAIGNVAVGATSLVTPGFAAPFATVYRNGLKLTPVVDYTLNGDGITINLVGLVVSSTDFFEVQTGFTYNPSTVYTPASTLVTPAFGATGITTVPYTAGFVYLYRNGARLVPGVDFTATDGVNINFIGFIGDGVTQYEVWSFIPLTVANMVSQSNPVLLAPLTFADGTQIGTQVNGRKNILLNGMFQIWQRGSSFSASTSGLNAYMADRWATYRTGWAGNWSASYATGLSLLGRGLYTGLSILRTSGDTSTAAFATAQCLESSDVRMLAGRTVTFSVWVCGLNGWIGKTAGISVTVGSGTDGSLYAGFTSQVNLGGQNLTLNGGWQQLSATITLPSNGSMSQLGLTVFANPTGTAGANENFFVTGAQLEISPVATDIEKTIIANELLLCKRWWEIGIQAWQWVSNAGAAVSSAYGDRLFQVQKRVAPTMTLTNWQYFSGGTAAAFTPSNVNPDVRGFQYQGLSLTNWQGWAASGTWVANAEQ